MPGCAYMALNGAGSASHWATVQHQQLCIEGCIDGRTASQDVVAVCPSLPHSWLYSYRRVTRVKPTVTNILTLLIRKAFSVLGDLHGMWETSVRSTASERIAELKVTGRSLPPLSAYDRPRILTSSKGFQPDFRAIAASSIAESNKGTLRSTTSRIC